MPRKRTTWSGSYLRAALAIVLIVGGYVALLIYFVNSYTERLERVHKAELRRIVELGLAALDPLRDEQAAASSYEELRREGAIALRNLTYRYRLGENYLFMVTDTGVVLAQPFAPEIEFTNQWDAVDIKGNYYIQEMVAAATGESGGGYVEYYYPPPGTDLPRHKISYVVYIPEWNAFIGAGKDLGSIEDENRRYLLNSLLLTAGLTLLILLVIVVTLRPTAETYATLMALFARVRSHPEILPDVPLHRFRIGSEGWTLLRDFQQMLEQIERSKQAREEAVIAERSRLARELHDAVSQTLFSATLIADVLPRLWERHPDVALERLRDLKELTRGALAEMRTLLIELRPRSLIKTPLDDLLGQLADGTVGRARLPVELDVTLAEPLPSNVKIAFYRVAQEAMNNIIKHARASAASITLHAADGQVVLRIIDDGRGFDPAHLPPGHLGVSIMRERIASIGGSLTIDSQPGQGTSITARWSNEPSPGG